MNNKYYITTFGCQMNKADSELIALSLSRSGFTESQSEEEADILIFNTCSVRQHAEDRAVARIKAAASKINNSGIIVLTGCMAQRAGSNAGSIADIVVGPYESPRMGEIITEHLRDKSRNLFNSLDKNDFINRIDPELVNKKEEHPWHRWITISHGCENFCSYCIVPYVRGPLISFPSESIINYANELALSGITEITLLGQNVNQYGLKSGIPFYRLLEKISNIKGLLRINFLTSHPKDFDENIISVIRDNKNISRSIHLPVQSGSNKILDLMNRKYSIEHYFNIIEKIRKELVDCSISTDIIVGFPGETQEDFEATLSMAEHIRFDEAFMYAYSPREGTAAFNLKEKIYRDEKLDRLTSLIALQRNISREKLKTRINSEDSIIVEMISKKSDNEVMGKTSLNHPVVITGDSGDIGKMISIKITGIRGSTLCGERIN